MAIEFIKDNKYEDKIGAELTIVNFFAEWCGPCKMFATVLTDLEAEGKIKVIKLDVDINQEAAKKAGVSGIPASYIYKDNKIVKNITGFVPLEELKNQLGSL